MQLPPGDGVLAHHAGPRGEVVLRRRADADGGGLELRVNGVLVMDSRHTRSEELLAQRALTGLAAPVRVLVGGLGLGFTLRALLADDRVNSVVVVEIEPAVVDWVRAGLVPPTAGVLDDPRVAVRVADVAEVVRTTAGGSIDVVLLDVDNGPGQLVHEHNTRLYTAAFVAECARALAPAGRVAVWSAEDSADLRATLAQVFPAVEVDHVPVVLQGRCTAYWVLRGGFA